MGSDSARAIGRRTIAAVTVLVLGVLAGSSAAAQPASGEGEERVPATPPRIVSRVAPELPGETAFPGDEVVVLLEMEVDETGRVVAVKVLEGPGAPFDEAARVAALSYSFEPARTEGGEPVPVTVTFRMRIPRPLPPPRPPVTIRGTLLERGTRKPLGAVPVVATADGELLTETVTDGEGRFTLVVDGEVFTLDAQPVSHERLRANIVALPGEERDLLYFLMPEGDGEDFELVVRSRRVRREITRRVIPKELVMRVPGTSGDTLKVVFSLPGVARSPFDGGDLVLRGANPGDSRVFLEGIDIPQIYHFGGLRSTFNPRFLEAVEFVPGNFAPDYGRATGGIIDVKVRDPASDLFRGEVDINTYDAGFGLEGPLGGGWSLGGAFHRSYIDSILPLVMPDDTPVEFTTAPRYYDYQLIAAYKPNEDHHARAIWFGSLDRLVLLFDEPRGDPVIRGAIDARIMFHNLLLQYDANVFRGLRQETTFSFGFQELSTEFGPEFFLNIEAWNINLRSAWTAEVTDWFAVRAGVDIAVTVASIDVSAPRVPTEGQQSVPISTRDTFSIHREPTYWEPAAFVELRFRPVEGLLILPSVRLDGYSPTERFTVDPRLTMSYEVPDTGFTLKGAVGLYHQPPDPWEVDPVYGDANLMSPRSVQAAFGFEQVVGDILRVELTAFYKWLDRIIVSNPEARSDTDASGYTNDGEGRIFGLELLIRAQVAGLFEGWIAYTFQRSFRRDGPHESERLFDFDQPHILTVVGRFELGRGWSIGARFRLVSGNPTTPVLGAIYDARSDTWVQVYGTTNSQRFDTFHQLDLRVDKIWTFESWKLNLYLDIQNVYYHANQEGWSYNYDYSERTRTTGIPILPILGIRGEW